MISGVKQIEEFLILMFNHKLRRTTRYQEEMNPFSNASRDMPLGGTLPSFLSHGQQAVDPAREADDGPQDAHQAEIFCQYSHLWTVVFGEGQDCRWGDYNLFDGRFKGFTWQLGHLPGAPTVITVCWGGCMV